MPAPAREPRPLTEDAVETEIVPPTTPVPGPAPASAPQPGEEPDENPLDGSYIDRIIADHGDWVAVEDCLYLGQVAFKRGAKVSRTHPGLPQWVAEKSVAQSAKPEDIRAAREAQPRPADGTPVETTPTGR